MDGKNHPLKRKEGGTAMNKLTNQNPLFLNQGKDDELIMIDLQLDFEKAGIGNTTPTETLAHIDELMVMNPPKRNAFKSNQTIQVLQKI